MLRSNWGKALLTLVYNHDSMLLVKVGHAHCPCSRMRVPLVWTLCAFPSSTRVFLECSTMIPSRGYRSSSRCVFSYMNTCPSVLTFTVQSNLLTLPLTSLKKERKRSFTTTVQIFPEHDPEKCIREAFRPVSFTRRPPLASHLPSQMTHTYVVLMSCLWFIVSFEAEIERAKLIRKQRGAGNAVRHSASGACSRS